MAALGTISCEICGDQRPWRDVEVERSTGSIHGVKVQRSVAHCGDTECKARARQEADEFAARWSERTGDG